MVFPLFLVAVTCLADRRLDPFQFNVCLWNLEGLDPIYSGLGGSRAEDEDTIAQAMYSSLSTCDIFLLPGLKNQTTAENLVEAMTAHDFTGFERYPKEGVYDSTILSRIDVSELRSFDPVDYTWPIEGSRCGYTGPPKLLAMNFSFYASVTFHEPVPITRVVSVRFKHGNGLEECAYREAQAAFLCDVARETFPEGDHVFLGGSFEANKSEPYHDILAECGFSDTVEWATGSEHYTRKVKQGGNQGEYVRWDMIMINQALKGSGYLDQLVFFHDDWVDTLSLTDYTYPMTLFVHQPLTPRWKTFEIVYSLCVVPVATAYFVILLWCSKADDLEDAYYISAMEDL